ncbi:MAG: DUF4347 domain-containing protein, partial [Gammaproteobacteria bacterium]|nr:DUF4347 domain-containing protein [Gammaproteobacteria bacterium]
MRQPPMKPSINTIDSNQKPVVESLEPRVLYSADAALLVSGFVFVDDDQGAGETPQIRLVDDSSEPTAAASSEGEVQPVEIVFVDSNVYDSERLQRIIEDQSYGRNTVIYSLAPNDDGVDRIAEILQQHDQVSAVHILTEGPAAGITLGDVQLNAGSLHSVEESLKSWRSGLSHDADILFYGCDYAVTEAGQNILNAISSLTGADVAASSDFGAADIGSNWATVSDWNPEHQLGDIESLPLLSDDAVENWRTIQHSITVDTDQDVVDGDADLSSIAALELNPGADGLVSLREAVLAANADVGLDEIVLDPGTYVISGGEMVVTEAVIIRGDTAANTILDAEEDSRFFNVNIPTAGTFTLEDITLANGHSDSVGGAMLVDMATVEITDAILTGNRADTLGGAIFTNANAVLNVTDSLLEDNRAVGDGGAIYSEGEVTIVGSEFIDNRADNGGAVYTKSGTFTLVVAESRFFNNYAVSDGGALYVDSLVSVSDSLFESNRADNDSGAIQVKGNGTITGSTFYQNTSGKHGGAMEVSGGSTELDVESSTFVGNSADSKGGAIRRTGGPVVEVSNSLFADNDVLGVPEDVEGQVVSLGFNLFKSTPTGGHYTSAVNDLIGIDPQVGALSDNGGRWHTVALNSNSPAINAGGGSTTDATGLGRNEIPDIGALEYRGPAPSAKIYWTDQENNSIHRANLDGSLSQEIYRAGASDYVYDLEVDHVNGYLYWIEVSTQHPDHDGAGYIMRSDLNGMNAAQFEPASGSRDMPMGLALDPDGGTQGYLYYITNVTAATFEIGDADYVVRYDLSDGTLSIVSVRIQNDYTDIEYDDVSDKLFVTDYNGEHDARGVMIFDLSDGNALTQIDLDPGEGPLSIAVVPGGEEAYLVSADGIVKWTEAGGVEAAV